MPAPQTVPPAPVPLNYVYCDSPATYASAVWMLRSAPYLILDCEGYNLGRAGGCVTLICVGTPFAEHIFLFDLLSPLITSREVYFLLHLLCNPTLLKVVWDGRMDYLEILTSYGVALGGVLDLQVAEVASRQTVRGEGDDDRLNRLRRSYISQQLAKKSEQLQDLHAVIGLQRCWTDCGYAREVGKDREFKFAFPDVLHLQTLLQPKLCSCIRIRAATCGSIALSPNNSFNMPRKTSSSLASSTPTSTVTAGSRRATRATTASCGNAKDTSPLTASRASRSSPTSSARALSCPSIP